MEELKLDPEDVDSIKISTAHRLGKKRSFTEVVKGGHSSKKPSGPRPIVVRFVIHNTRDKLKKDGNKALRAADKAFRISDQYPHLQQRTRCKVGGRQAVRE